MKISIQNFKSLHNKTTFDLRKVNLFVGANNTGKSALGKFFQTMNSNSRNTSAGGLRLDAVNAFAEQGEDWRSLVFKGDTNHPLVFEIDLEVYGTTCTARVTFEYDPNRHLMNHPTVQCGGISEIQLFFGKYRLVRWEKERKEFYPTNIIGWIKHSFEQNELPSYEDQMDFSSIARDALGLNHFSFQPIMMGDIEQLMSELPNKIAARELFLVSPNANFKDIFKSLQISLIVPKKQISIQSVMYIFMFRLISYANGVLTQSSLHKGTTEPQWFDFFSDDLNASLKNYFGFEIERRALKYDDGEVFDHRYFVLQNGVRSPLWDCGSGVSKVISWLTDWYNHFEMDLLVNADPDSAPQVIVIREPERELHPDWQLAWVSWLQHEISKKCYSHISVIIETHSPTILKAFQLAVEEGEWNAENVCVFDFTKNEEGETSVKTIELGDDGNLKQPISAGWMSAVITKEDRLRLKRFSRLD